MLDQVKFGEKLRKYRKSMGLTQDELGERIGVSGQAVSKWESGECLPDCYNLKALSDLYGISLDILLDTATGSDIKATAKRIKQLATEYVWVKMGCCADEEAFRELGDDLWEMARGIFFTETGDRELQDREEAAGRARITGIYGCKVWDDAGISCTVMSKVKEKLSDVSGNELDITSRLASPEYFPLLRTLDCFYTAGFDELHNRTGIAESELGEMLRYLTECGIVEYFSSNDHSVRGYRLTGRRGIAAYMILAINYLLAERVYTVSEYLPH